MIDVRIIPSGVVATDGKLAEAELHFTEGPLAGLKLIGFAIWERRGGAGNNVTFPRRSLALRRVADDGATLDSVRDMILRAYALHVPALAEATA